MVSLAIFPTLTRKESGGRVVRTPHVGIVLSTRVCCLYVALRKFVMVDLEDTSALAMDAGACRPFPRVVKWRILHMIISFNEPQSS